MYSLCYIKGGRPWIPLNMQEFKSAVRFRTYHKPHQANSSQLRVRQHVNLAPIFNDYATNKKEVQSSNCSFPAEMVTLPEASDY